MLMAQRKFEYSTPNEYQSYPEELFDLRPNRTKKIKSAPKKKASTAIGLKSLCMMITVVTIFGLIGAKTIHTTVVKGAELKAIQKEIDTLSAENTMLQIEKDKLSSVSRIEKAALAMGMEKPQGTIFIASNLIKPANTAGVENTQQNIATPAPEAPNTLASIFKAFTSFFAITQR
ncbi:Septum formation initiator [Syntrophobotulus glycolicus DSM 8271]|uniref:Septum formation initiator n=1 Tax=Syntrophobotulus glycolicus (strain DSM 8271 / FlGlyR) TaxID=645991 RepID=F0SZZ2_SYNGF|nr:septum formation initiator family protein [Syntrophobotulus glycolicus]ADY55003.1 Septum formation initiator [Syntrophobotulus glycolicus DSM 8271]